MKMAKLNLSCGKDYREGYINVDIVKSVKPDILTDLNFDVPFRDCIAEEVLLMDILEHVNDPCRLIEEIWRVCIPKAKVIIRAPHFTSASTYADMQHKRGLFPTRV